MSASDPTDTRAPGDPAAALGPFRRYVTGFVNRHDFTVLPEIMRPDYTLITSGHEISGRDGPYRAAVSKQMGQFPDLQFTVHDIFVCGNEIGVRFTEHGASALNRGAGAAWPSIAIYEVQDGLLARCTIEQDYYSRRRQLEGGVPVPVDRPAVAPWDEAASTADPQGAAAVADWLAKETWLDGSVAVDDSAATGGIEPVIAGGSVAILKILSGKAASGDTKVAFHVLQSGPVTTGFAAAAGASAPQTGELHLSGLVTLRDGKIVGGNIIRDRWGLFRRLSKAARP